MCRLLAPAGTSMVNCSAWPVPAARPMIGTPFDSTESSSPSPSPPPLPPAGVCPGLQAPNECAADGCQPKSSYWLPLPASCSEVPLAVLLVSDCVIGVLACPAAGPSLALKLPS